MKKRYLINDPQKKNLFEYFLNKSEQKTNNIIYENFESINGFYENTQANGKPARGVHLQEPIVPTDCWAARGKGGECKQGGYCEQCEDAGLSNLVPMDDRSPDYMCCRFDVYDDLSPNTDVKAWQNTDEGKDDICV